MQSSPTLAKAKVTLLVCDYAIWREIFVSFTGVITISILGYTAKHDVGFHTLVVVVTQAVFSL